MRRVAAFLLVATAILPVLTASPALGCSCGESTRKDDARRASAVFVGVADGHEEIEGALTARNTSFFVEAVYKGDVEAGSIVPVHHETQDGACGLRFPEGVRFTVLAYESEGQLHSNSCWENARGRIPGSALGLDRPSEVVPAPENSGGYSPWILGALVILLALGAWAIARWARGRPPAEPRV